MNICNKILEELEPGLTLRSREFRAKFPDDIMTDNLAGQLWFGAECLAAGSSIMNKETESEAMRPLAKAVTKSLEKVGVQSIENTNDGGISYLCFDELIIDCLVTKPEMPGLRTLLIYFIFGRSEFSFEKIACHPIPTNTRRKSVKT